jgi:hypothetical protein
VAHLASSCPDPTDSLSNRSKVIRIRVKKSGTTDLQFKKQRNNFDENWGNKRMDRPATPPCVECNHCINTH